MRYGFVVTDHLTLDEQICFPLYAASRAMTAVYRPVLDRLGLTYPQYLVLLALWERDGRGVGELGDALSLDSGTLSPLLKRLETVGLVERRRQETDERRVHVHLTEAGRAVRAAARGLPDRVAAATRLTTDDLVELRSTLKQLTDSLLSYTNRKEES